MKDDKNRMEENVNNIIENAMESLKHIVESNVTIGKPLLIDKEITIVPISKVNVGFVAGGGEVKCNLKKIKSDSYPFTGGSGSGFVVNPIGFISINKGEISYVPVDNSMPYNEIFTLTEKIVNKIIAPKKENNNEKN